MRVPASLVAVSLLTLATVGLVTSARIRNHTRRLTVDYGVFVVFAATAVTGIWLFVNRDREFFREVLQQYWLPALLFVFVLEGAMLLYFAPSESLVPIAIGMTLSTDVAPATWPVWTAVILTAVLGATIGQYLLFLLAKRWGRERLLQRPWFRISDDQLDRFEGWFERWGLLAVPLSNTLLFTRGMLTVPAGLSEMRDRHFLLASAIGTLSFETLLALLTHGVLEIGLLNGVL
jgi:membrane protein DedA with SNARE-associated domain